MVVLFYAPPPKSLSLCTCCTGGIAAHPVAGVLDEPYSQLTALSGVAVQAYIPPGWNRVYVAWRAGMATTLSVLS